MSTYAVITGATPEGTLLANATVENVIVLDPEQKEEMERLLYKFLLDTQPLELAIGDLYDGQDWTRNVNGEQKKLKDLEA